MASGYDISASASQSSAASTGAIKFGAVTLIGSGNGGNSGGGIAGFSWTQILLFVVLPGGFIAAAIWYFLKKRKS